MDYERPVMSTSIPKGATNVKMSQFKRHLEHIQEEINSLESTLDDLYAEQATLKSAIETMERHINELDEIQTSLDEIYYKTA